MLPQFWIQQYDAVRKLKNCGIVSTIDIGDLDDIHPKNKYDVGLRLASLALRDAYGRKNVVASGPTYKSLKIAGDRIIVCFENTGSGLMTKDRKSPDWFEISGADKVFHPASVGIEGQTVVLSSREVEKAEYVRFAWNGNAEPNLRNKEGLPAFPFNTAHPFFQQERPLVLGVVKLIKSAVGINMKSQAAVPLQGVIRLKSSAFAGYGSANYELASGEEKTVIVPVALKKDVPETLELTAMISAQGEMLNFVCQLKNSPVVELKEGVWTEQFKIEKLSDGNRPSSAVDLSATFALSREENALLIKVYVKDNKTGDFTRPDSPWEEDCIELFLDMNPLQAGDINYPEKYADTTYQIAVSPNRKTESNVYCKKLLNGLTVKPAIKKNPDGYETDIRVEFAEPLDDKSIGFELAIDDSDGAGRKTQLIWSGAGAMPNFRDRSGFGVLCFE